MTLEQLRDNSYVPYSGKPSICVVKSVKGNYFPGVRVENTSFPLTLSAARNALFCCISEGETPKAAYVDPGELREAEYLQKEFKLWVHELDQLDDCDFATVLITEDEMDITRRLDDLLSRARVPQSDFPVSALLETPIGFVSGANIECNDWSLGLCAERVALAKAISLGITDFRALYLHTEKGEFSSPCGACRQVIAEHMPDRRVHMHHSDGSVSVLYASELLPYSFHSTVLKKKTNKE